MPSRRVIAHFMHETEKHDAMQRLQVESATDSFVIGSLDDGQIAGLRAQGLVVEELPEPAPQAEPAMNFALSMPQLRARARAFAMMPLELATPDEQQTQYFLIWLRGPLLEEWRTALGDVKVVLEEALPGGAYKARLEPSQVSTVRQLPFVARVTVLSPLESAADFITHAPEAPAPPLAGKRALVFDILLRREADQQPVQDWLAQNQVPVLGASRRKIRVSLLEDSPLLQSIPALPEVERLEEYVPPELHNDHGRSLLMIDQAGNGSIAQTGAGQLVAIADTGIDDAHPDFAGRIRGKIGLGRPGVTDDPHGHGTHVAGSVAGDGSASGGSLRGAAPAAEIYFQSLLDAQGKLGGLPLDLGDLFEEAWQQGARIHNNSWGAATASRYTINANEVDDFVARRRDMLIVISAGNSGTAAPPLVNAAQGHVDWLSIGSPASCKNALTVGASRSDRTTGGFAPLTYGQAWPQHFPHAPMASEPVSTHPDRVAGFSSRGPTDDHRIKPDVVAPGTDIASARSSLAPLTNFWGAFPGNPRYAYMGGTSMAAPLVAGCAALVREYLAADGNADPSAALVKALLINGTRRLGGWDATAPAVGEPNYHQGFGVIHLADTLPNPARPALVIRYVDNWQAPGDHLSRTGERRRYNFTVTGPCASLRLCLAYTDPPGRSLQNDLDLFLQTPAAPQSRKLTGNEKLPNRLTATDRDNNVEVIRLDAPAPGQYLIQITAANLLHPPQDFALVVSGENLSNLQPVPGP